MAGLVPGLVPAIHVVQWRRGLQLPVASSRMSSPIPTEIAGKTSGSETRTSSKPRPGNLRAPANRPPGSRPASRARRSSARRRGSGLELPIVDLHHHLWDRGSRYLLDEFRADLVRRYGRVGLCDLLEPSEGARSTAFALVDRVGGRGLFRRAALSGRFKRSAAQIVVRELRCPTGCPDALRHRQSPGSHTDGGLWTIP